MRRRTARWPAIVAAGLIGCAAATVALAQCPPTVPVQGAPIPGPLPLFPPDNWWNLDGRRRRSTPRRPRISHSSTTAARDGSIRTSAAKRRRPARRSTECVADNGTDLYVTGTFDTRWSNDILNPAFAALTAGDFDVIRLGWNPAVAAPAFATLSLLPPRVVGGRSLFVVVTLTAPAGSGGATVTLASSDPALAAIPAAVVVPAGATWAKVMVGTRPTRRDALATLSATAGGVTRSTEIAVTVR